MNYEAIKKAMQHELDNPQTCYMPCSPGEYVLGMLLPWCIQHS